MVKLYVKENGLSAATNVIASMAQRGVNTRPLMGRIGQIMLTAIGRNFESEGRPRWKPLSPLTKELYSGRLIDQLRATKGYQKIKKDATRQRREQAFIQKKGGSKLLQQSGDLRKSVVIGKFSKDSVEVGSPLIYARIHALGGEIRPKNKKSLLIPLGGGQFLHVRKVTIPARNYLQLQNEDGVTIMMATKDYLLEGKYHG